MNIEEQRNNLREHLENIIKQINKIDGIMSDVPHSRGTARISLKPKSGQYIFHHKDGKFQTTYEAQDGKEYQITIEVSLK